MIYIIYAGSVISVIMIIMGLGQMLLTNQPKLISLYEARLVKQLDEMFIDNISARQIMIAAMFTAIVMFIFVVFITGSLIVAFILSICTFYAPLPYFDVQRQARKTKFEIQLPATLDMLANSTKAGLSLAQAIEQTAESTSKPMSEEFSLIVRDYKLGVDLKEALKNSLERLQSKTYDLTVTALIVNREKGGNLPEALFTISSSLKEIWRLEQKLITASAEGRKSIWVISGMPVFIFLMIMSSQPEMMMPLVETAIGIVLLIVAILLYVLGFYWLINILRIDI